MTAVLESFLRQLLSLLDKEACQHVKNSSQLFGFLYKFSFVVCIIAVKNLLCSFEISKYLVLSSIDWLLVNFSIDWLIDYWLIYWSISWTKLALIFTIFSKICQWRPTDKWKYTLDKWNLHGTEKKGSTYGTSLLRIIKNRGWNKRKCHINVRKNIRKKNVFYQNDSKVL